MLFKYFLAWFGMMLMAVLNGGARDLLYKPQFGDLAAHQISTIVLLVLFAAYFGWLTALWRIESAKQAWKIGTMWMLMTLAFEVVLGRVVLSYPWSRVMHDYNLFAGNIWVLVPIWTLIGPYVFFRLR